MKSFLSIDLGELVPQGRMLPRADYVREVTEEDLQILGTDRASGQRQGYSIGEIKFVHHNAARLLALGWPVPDVSIAVGMSPQTIASLKEDPTFQELISHYAQCEREATVDVRARMVQLGLSASDELQKRVTETPEVVNNKDLLGILQTALDRGGHAPVQKQATVNLSLTSEELAVIKGAIAQGTHNG